MNILINILAALFCTVIGYLFGSIPTAIWLGKSLFNQDPRDYGSHNAGGTNAGRIWGKKIGLLVIVLDMIKAAISLWICWVLFTLVPFVDGQALSPTIDLVNNFGINTAFIIPWPVYWFATIGCMVGHCWPLFAQFKGGKGVSVFAGTVLLASWMLAILPCMIYFLILKLTKYVSLASIITPIITTLISWVWAILVMTKVIPPSLYFLPTYGWALILSWVFSTVLTIESVFVLFRHSENIKRLKKGTERKISWMK
ncbi:MAG: glycerol-3-phosphate 1-O-acyltransferase PlsY [Erysipelotrichaceae bacterium]|nr:glycerol-3-phosphate 1-O-acyltransferase PlsY [Erysipelotrichaceae bacterium]